MDIEVLWRTPITLKIAPADWGQDYYIPESAYSRLPTGPGVYVFCRKHGRSFEPLYVGQADRLRARVDQHLRTNVALMKALRAAKTGARAILVGEIVTKQGQQAKRVLDVVERTLIADAVEAGFTLVNKQLTQRNFHQILLGGPKSARGPFLRSYSIPIS